MEDVLFHATLISEITDHSKVMDTDFVYEAFMSWRGLVVVNVVVAAVVVCLFCLLVFFCQTLRSTMPSSGHSL